MIQDIIWWWEQLNGPQVRGIMRPIFLYLQEQFDTILDYLNNMSIDTAGTDHLTLMGKLMGIPRTNMTEYDTEYMLFTYDLSRRTEYGVALIEAINPDAEEKDVGTTNKYIDPPYVYTEEDIAKHGVFSEDLTGRTGVTRPLEDIYYRTILKSVVISNCAVGSLGLMDQIIHDLQEQDAIVPVYDYTFSWYTGEASINGSPGDIILNLGDELKWNNVTIILAAIESLTGSIYAPEPQWTVEFNINPGSRE